MMVISFQVLESIPQIPIHVTEIKKLILKDKPRAMKEDGSSEDDHRLLSVLTNGSTGRNPTFFKALGHEDVFGLRADLPAGCQTLEVAEAVPGEDGAAVSEENVLYAQLPDGHPVITEASSSSASPDHETSGGGRARASDDNDESNNVETEVVLSGAAEGSVQVILSNEEGDKSADQAQSLSLEEAIEQADFIFGDDFDVSDMQEEEEEEEEVSSDEVPSETAVKEGGEVSNLIVVDEVDGKAAAPSVCEPIAVDVSGSSSGGGGTNVAAASPRTRSAASPSVTRTSPRISPRIQSKQRQQLHELNSTKDESSAVPAVAAAAVAAAPPVTTSPKTSKPPAAAPAAVATAAAPVAAAPAAAKQHNLRPKRSLRHVTALKQQAKRRKRNTSVAAGGSPVTQRALVSRRASITNNGGEEIINCCSQAHAQIYFTFPDIEISYKPSGKELSSFMSSCTSSSSSSPLPSSSSQTLSMKSVLSSIPGFPHLSKLKPSAASKKANNKKMSITAAIQQVRFFSFQSGQKMYILLFIPGSRRHG